MKFLRSGVKAVPKFKLNNFSCTRKAPITPWEKNLKELVRFFGKNVMLAHI